MPNAERKQEIEDAIDGTIAEQREDDASYRRDLEVARRSGRGEAFRERTRKYVEDTNRRARRIGDLNDEWYALDSPAR